MGDAIVFRKINDDGVTVEQEHSMPFEAVFEFIVEQVRQQRIANLEVADPLEVLNL